MSSRLLNPIDPRRAVAAAQLFALSLAGGLTLASCACWCAGGAAHRRTPAEAAALAAVDAARTSPTPPEIPGRMDWWREARFGMFIHWGLYAVLGGYYHGQPVEARGAGGKLGEWIMNSANIPQDEYAAYANQFNPVDFDAARWVSIAKGAGMKYMVITSKHHEGFSMFDTQASSYSVVQATPYGKDPIGALARECHRQGLRFGVYYSIMDWHHPAQERANAQKYDRTKMRPGRKAEYMAFMKQQLRELVENYDVDILWFDGEWPEWYPHADGLEIYNYVRSLKPSIIINNRVDNGRKGSQSGFSRNDQEYAGDFGTPEQRIPPNGLPGLDWESCMTINDTWGFKKDDTKWKSAQKLARDLIDCASKGGNYLLNVGPDALGNIPAPCIERLADMGRWARVNGEAIYGTHASPLADLPDWGRITMKPGSPCRLYLHVFERPAGGRIDLPLANRPLKAGLLTQPATSLEVETGSSGLSVRLPDGELDPIATVIVLEIDGEPRPIRVQP